jgi:hypothetical protein
VHQRLVYHYSMTDFLAAAAGSTDSAVNPLIFVLGALALVVVSTLGPLSRMHERSDEHRREARAATKPAEPKSE